MVEQQIRYNGKIVVGKEAEAAREAFRESQPVFVDFEKHYAFDKPAQRMLWHAYGIMRNGRRKWLSCRPTEEGEFGIDADIRRFKSYDWYQPQLTKH